jgi:hypothetical protein
VALSVSVSGTRLFTGGLPYAVRTFLLLSAQEAIAWFAVFKDRHKKTGDAIAGSKNKPTD